MFGLRNALMTEFLFLVEGVVMSVFTGEQSPARSSMGAPQLQLAEGDFSAVTARVELLRAVRTLSYRWRP